MEKVIDPTTRAELLELADLSALNVLSREQFNRLVDLHHKYSADLCEHGDRSTIGKAARAKAEEG